MTPTVSRQEIDDLKARVHLAELLQHHGVEIRKIGRGVKALCPFHDEKTPSLSIDVRKGLYHCFGCGKSGDHLTFLQEHAKFSFADAVAELSRHACVSTPEPAPPDPDAKKPFPYELMERVVEIWHQAFCEQPEALAYLEGRGIYDKGLLRDLRVGYCDGEKLLAISNAQERQLLQRVGILNEGGKELFARCVVFALRDRHNRVTGFYGRSVSHNAKVQHRCAGNGIFHPQALQGASSVILVEGVLDALSVIQSGFSNVVALGGVQGFSASLLEQLQQAKVQEIVLCLDGDEAGEQASEILKERLLAEKFAVRCVPLPTGLDPLSLKTELLRELLAGPMDNAKRSYRKLSAAQGKLKVLICVENEGQREEATVDLYSARSRRQEALTVGRRLGLEPQDLEKWFFRVLTELEEAKGQDAQLKEMFAPVHVPPMSSLQREEALAFLTDTNLVQRILADMESLGYMGEEEAKLLGYCVSVSRLLDKPLSAIIQSGSGAGKSFLAETVQELTPPEGVVFYSRLSPQALYHMPKDYLRHKMVRMEERVGGESCDYQIRALQSANVLKQCIVVKDPITGQLHAKENEVLGPIAYWETTTSLYLNPENTSRCFEIPLDESPEQTRRIHERQKVLKTLEGLAGPDHREKIVERHHCAQRLLEKVAVVLPYVHKLTFPDNWLRARRDHDRFLHLIEVLAFLHQHQRPRKNHQGREYIEATVADYRWAYFLASRVLSQSMDELTRWARELLSHVERTRPKEGLTRRELRETLQWPDRRTREALEELVELEFLEVNKGANNRYSFHLAVGGASSRATTGLLHPDELETIWV